MSNEIPVDSLNSLISKFGIGGKKPVKRNSPVGKFRQPVPITRRRKKQEKTEFNYSMGPREGYTRIVGPDSISTHVKPVKISIDGLLSESGNVIDGEVGSSRQGKRGDCYLLASINSIRNTEDGQAIFKKNIKQNSDGSITVTLPGAVAIRNQYLKEGKGNGCEVTGVYHITQDALQKAIANAGRSYSKGDLEVIALEIAMENYRAEMVVTKQNLGDTGKEAYTAEAATNHLDGRDFLGYGQSYDATFILTGQKSEVYSCKKNKYNNVKPYKGGEYGYITREEMERREAFNLGSNRLVAAKGMSEVTNVTHRDSDLQRLLDKYQGHEDDFALTFSVRVAKNGPDGATKAGGGHALAVVKITDSTVYVSNPWYPDKIEPIPRGQFEAMATGFSATPMSEKKVSGTYMANAMNDINNGVSSNEADSLRESLNRLIAERPTKIPQKMNSGIAHLSSEKVTEFLDAYNAYTPSKRLDAKTLLRQINNAPKIDLTKEQLDVLNRLFAQIKSNETIKLSAEDANILQSLSNRKS